MWNFGSSCASPNVCMKKNSLKQSLPKLDSSDSDNEVSSVASKEERLECPICCESFNIVENVPYVLWCGHTLCKNCIVCLQWAVVKFPALPIQLPLFISCPWCNLLSLRLVYRGELRFPRKNYFLLWMIESRNGDRVNSHSTTHTEIRHHQENRLASNSSTVSNRGAIARAANLTGTYSDGTRALNYLTMERLHTSLQKSLVFFVHLTAKLPLVIVFLLIAVYAVPTCAVVLIIYILVTLVFAIPSFFVLYFAYPGLDWLVGEILS
ncbi:unnamed protein product [Rhodiola kirilowii]